MTDEKTKHTPGPWRFDFAKTYWHVGGPTDVDGTCGYICRIPARGPAEANARLIASAPDLLEALTEIACFDDKQGNARLAATGDYGAFDEPASVKIARAAIAKASTNTPSPV